MLNWPRLIIFRLGSEPKSLQTHRNLFENTKKHPPKKPKNVKFSQNRCFVQNGFLKSRPPTAALADPPEAKCSYIDPLSFILSSKTGFSRPKNDLLPQVFDLDPRFSWKSTFSFGAFFDLFLVEHGPNISLGPTGPKWMGPTGPNRRYSNTIRHYSDAIQTLFGAIQMLFRRYSTLFKHYSDTIRRYSNAIWTLFDAIQTLFRRYSDAIQTLFRRYSDAIQTLFDTIRRYSDAIQTLFRRYSDTIHWKKTIKIWK